MNIQMEYFDKYLDKNAILNSEIISNNKGKIIVFREKIDDEIIYIKKYKPYYFREKFWLKLKLRKDKVEHYIDICTRLEKIGIQSIKPIYTKIKKYGFFERESIMVLKNGGGSLENKLKNFTAEKEILKEYFDVFIKLCKNHICPYDYNLGGALLGKNGKLVLIDFDGYKKERFLTNSKKRHLIFNLQRIYRGKDRTKEDEKILKNEIKRVVKELGWEKVYKELINE